MTRRPSSTASRMKRCTSHGQETWSTLGCSRVIHFMTRSHPRRIGRTGREPALDGRDVALWVLCEGLETTAATEGVLAVTALDGQAPFSLLGDVDDHAADRVEHLAVTHSLRRLAGPPIGVARITHLVRGSRARRGAADRATGSRCRADHGTVPVLTGRPGSPRE